MATFPTRSTAASYLHHDDSYSDSTKRKTSVTVASTIIDQQGVVKAVIHPRMVNPFPMIFCPYLSRSIDKHRSEQYLIPVRYNQQRTKTNIDRQLSLLFFWSMPLRAKIYQLSTRPTRIEDLSTRFERHTVKMSIGIQNGQGDETIGSHLRYYNRSEIALSNTDEGFDQSHSSSLNDHEETFDSLSYRPIVNDEIVPIGILKKKKFDHHEWNSKKMRSDSMNVSWTDETTMRNRVLMNVNLCVDHLSKLLGEKCPDRLASNNNYQQSSSQISDDQRSISMDNDNRLLILSNDIDGIVLHRGINFGKDLGDPMIRLSDLQEECRHTHPIEQFDQLLSPITCQQMRQYRIETIEDLIQLFLHHGNDRFTYLMIHYFQIDQSILNQLTTILTNWSKPKDCIETSTSDL